MGFKLFNNLPVGERKEYTISYDFHILRGKRKRLVNHKLTPLILTKDGRIWLAICTISLASGNERGNVIMKKPGSGMFYQYSLYDHKWEEHKEIVLTENEREVLFALDTRIYNERYRRQHLHVGRYKSNPTSVVYFRRWR